MIYQTTLTIQIQPAFINQNQGQFFIYFALKMIQLSNIFKKVKLITNLQFLFHQKPRQPSVPTQASTLLPFNINCLHDNPGARRYPPIIGRGPGSGRGKTAGRGHKGNKARQGGGVHVRFEGGQTPISRRLPKYGRVVQRRPQQYFNYVNLQNIVYFIKRNIINPNELITLKVLNDCGLIKKVKSGVKILGRGAQKVTFPIKLEATDASKSVIEAVKNAGGQIRLVHRTPLKLRQHLYPQKYPLPLRQPITPAWKARALQRKAEHRGIEYIFNKPKWMLLNQVQEEKPKSNFIFPVPRIPNSGKIRQRKAKLYKKINYNL